MKCIFCGAEINENSIYCPICGKEVQIVPDYNSFEDDYLKVLIQETTPDVATPTPDHEEKDNIKTGNKTVSNSKQTTSNKKKKSNKTIIITAVLAVFCIAIGITVIVAKNKIRENQDNSFEYQYSMAEQANRNNDSNLALTYYEKALKLSPDNMDVKKAMFPIYMKQMKYDNAAALCKDIIRKDQTNVDAYQALITIYQSKSDLNAIIELSKGVTDEKVMQLFAEYIVTPPIFSEIAGTYDKYLDIELSTSGNYNILYNMDGNDPKKSGRRYLDKIALDEMKTYEISAVCVNEKGIYSDVVTKKYIIDIPAPDMPIVSPDGGTFSSEMQVHVVVPQGCSAYYTWDGTNPSASSSPYRDGIDIPEGNNVLSVIIIDNNTQLVSDIYRGNFVYYTNE